MRISTEWLGYAGIAVLVAGATVGITLILVNPQSAPRRAWSAYVAGLERECRFLFLRISGAQVARRQLLIGLAVFVVQLAWMAVSAVDTDDVFLVARLLVPWVVIGLVPKWWLDRQHHKRVAAIETQLDSWLLILANALKASPSLGEALRASAKIMRAPLGQELDLSLKEITLGIPIDQAVLTMSRRIGSRTVSGALATILVGRQTGGDLPLILEQSAATLREMARLEGVVRTKTAEGKSEAYVLGAIPFVLIGAIQLIDPHWLQPLTETSGGLFVILVAMGLWIGAILAARKILAVDV